MYKVAKLKSHDSKRDEELTNRNLELAKGYSVLGIISGGSFYVETGESFKGDMDEFPKVGDRIRLSQRDVWFVSSEIKEIEKETEISWLVKTNNSLYRLEKLEEGAK